MKSKSTKYTVMVVPHDSSRTRSFGLSQWQIRLFKILFFAFALTLGTVIFFSSKISIALMSTRHLEAKNAELFEENKQVKTLKRQIDSLQWLNQRIENIAAAYINPTQIDESDQEPNSSNRITSEKSLNNYLRLVEENYQKRGKDEEFTVPNIMPVIGIITRKYGQRMDDNSLHLGIDIAGILDDPVYATGTGVVISAKMENDLGNCIRIRHPNNYITIYGHLNSLLVKKGDNIKRGTPVGTIGLTGHTSGPHLHYAIQHNGKLVNPEDLLLK